MEESHIKLKMLHLTVKFRSADGGLCDDWYVLSWKEEVAIFIDNWKSCPSDMPGRVLHICLSIGRKQRVKSTFLR